MKAVIGAATALAATLASPVQAEPLNGAADLYVTCRAVVEVHAGGKDQKWLASLGNGDRDSGLIRLGVSYGHCVGYIASSLDAFAALRRADGSPYFCLTSQVRHVDVASAIVAKFEDSPVLAASWPPRLAVWMALEPYECGEER